MTPSKATATDDAQTGAGTASADRKPALAAKTLRALRSAPLARNEPTQQAAPENLDAPDTETPPVTDTDSNDDTVEITTRTDAEAATQGEGSDHGAAADLATEAAAGDTGVADPDAAPTLPARRRTATKSTVRETTAKRLTATSSTTATRSTTTRPATKALAATAPPARRRPGALVTGCAALAVAALVFALVSGVAWWRAGHSSDRTAALARDRVVVDARLAIATVNTADYRKPSAALDNWLAASTGTLHSQFADSRKSATSLLTQAKMITSATVLDAAVTSLDTAKGTATVIASVNVVRKPVSGAATTTRNRFRGSLKLVDGQWKLADLAIVPVGLS